MAAARSFSAVLVGGLRKAMSAVTIAAMLAGAAAPAAAACPEPLASATRLLLVTAPDMASVRAEARLFERTGPGEAWQEVGAVKRAVVGRTGMGWGLPYRGFAAAGEPVKAEGDGRSPAGFFGLGPAFGFAAGVGDYLRLVRGDSFCVDDVASPHYNTIVPQAVAGAGVSGERMWTIEQYRRGLLVDYPSDRSQRGGSCIFLHIWRSPRAGTAGCVALAEADVAALQSWSQTGATVIGILPAAALARFRDCLPGVGID